MRKYIYIIFLLIFLILNVLTYNKHGNYLEIGYEVIPTTQDDTIPITDRNASDRRNAVIGETIATIRIDEIGIYAPVTYGASQQQVDINEICLTESNQFDNSYAIVAGHAYKSFSKLADIEISDLISIHSYYGDFNYKVTSITYGYTDGYNIYDNTGKALLDLYPSKHTLYIYSCYLGAPNNRILIIAEQI